MDYLQEYRRKNKTGHELIHEERELQKLEYNRKHDEYYINNELPQVAEFCITLNEKLYPSDWSDSFKQKVLHINKIKQLMYAGAFYMAENERSGEQKYNDNIEAIALQIDTILYA